MIGNLKVLGLAMVILLTIGTAGASLAQAAPKVTAEEYPAILDGQIEATFNFGKNYPISCTGSATKEISAASTELLMPFASTECLWAGAFPVDVTLNECSYSLLLIKPGEKETEYQGEAGLFCPESGRLEFQLTLMGSKVCKIRLLPHLRASLFKNDAGAKPSENDVTVTTTAKSLAYELVGALCSPAAGTYFTGEYTGKTTLSGTKGKKEPNGVDIG